ncbi:MAG: ABC transporter substrate-binding protein [bacterium]|jgi:peptide/nickel transport system substrate-binding protein|nr:ABC transporter substrate-binding protein [bacterium]
MQQHSRRLLIITVAVLIFGFGTALGQGTPQRGGILNWFDYADPARLDLHTESPLNVSQAIVGLYSGLVQWGPQEPKKVSPDLAHRWEVSPEGTTYTFHLRRGVKWHDGAPFSSADALFSLQRIIDPEVRSPRCGSLLRPLVKSIEAPDEVTVKVHLKFPTTIVLPALASAWCKILPKHILQRDGDLTRPSSQIGTGPFKLKKYVRGNIIEWERNPDYFIKGLPYLDGVKQFIIKPRATQMAAIKAGKVDFWFGWPPLNKKQRAEIIKARKDLIYRESPPGGISQLHMNTTKPPFDNTDMRRAVNLAIDRQEIAKKVYDGFIIPCAILPKEAFGDYALPTEEVMQSPGCRQPKQADLDEAKRLVAKHYPDGLDIEVAVRSVGNYVNVASLVVQQLKKIGIRGKLKTWESAAGFAAWAQGNFTLIAVQATAMTFMEPSAPFTLMWTTKSPRNYGRLPMTKMDELYEKGLREQDESKRIAIYHEYQRLILRGDSPIVTYGWPTGPWYMAKKLKGWAPGPTIYDNASYHAVWIEK